MPTNNNPSHDAILLEEIRADVKLVIEHTSGLEERLTQQIQAAQEENRQHFDSIDLILKHHTQLLEQVNRQVENNDMRLNSLEA